jgi:hypothetical protein
LHPVTAQPSQIKEPPDDHKNRVRTTTTALPDNHHALLTAPTLRLHPSPADGRTHGDHAQPENGQ